jgi:hypothetical protein
MGLKGTRFATMEGTKLIATAELRNILTQAFRTQVLTNSGGIGGASVSTQGSYFEGDQLSFAYVLPLQCKSTFPGTFLLPNILLSLQCESYDYECFGGTCLFQLQVED